jgi:hypothetical protein
MDQQCKDPFSITMNDPFYQAVYGPYMNVGGADDEFVGQQLPDQTQQQPRQALPYSALLPYTGTLAQHPQAQQEQQNSLQHARIHALLKQ